MRASDVVVGIIAGAVCAVLAAAFEAGILAFRFFTIGHLGDHFAFGLVLLGVVGAAGGGLIGFGVNASFNRLDTLESPTQAQ